MTEETIREVLAQHAKLSGDASTIGVDDDLYAAGMTSHASVNVMLALEDAFDIEFPEELLRRQTFASVSAIREAVEGLAE
ncbi:acyl carrier protein [Actinomycetota bacterium]